MKIAIKQGIPNTGFIQEFLALVNFGGNIVISFKAESWKWGQNSNFISSFDQQGLCYMNYWGIKKVTFYTFGILTRGR